MKRKNSKIKNKFKNFMSSVLNTVSIFALAIIIAGVFILKNNTFANSLTFAQISDAHFSTLSANTSYKLLAESKELLADAIEQVNETPNVDFVMFTGDMINKPFEKELLAFLPYANKLHAPWYAVYGNHDICIGGKLSKKLYLKTLNENNKNFNFESPYYSFAPKKDFWVIGLDTIIDDRLTCNGQISKEQLEWLDNELQEHQNDVVLIFMHVPIIPPFKSEKHELLNSEEVLKILHKYDNPIAIFSGHYHATKIFQKDNLLFVSTPSLVTYPNAFRLIKVVNNRTNAEFKILLKETRYKSVQKRAKLMTFAVNTYIGGTKDRNSTYTIYKNKRAENEN